MSCFYRAHTRYDVKVMFSQFLSFCLWGRGGLQPSSPGGEGESWGKGVGRGHQATSTRGDPSYIAYRCY